MKPCNGKCFHDVRLRYMDFQRENASMGYPRSFGEDAHLTFNVGDTVYLKSGGCPMTVMAVTTDNRVLVAWQNFYGELSTREFSVSVVTHEAPPVPDYPDPEYPDYSA
jgi:uncharacterized protein YodC (DUF2158 family)